MKRNFLMTLAYAFMSIFSIAQSEETNIQTPILEVESEAPVSNSGYVANYRNPAQDLIDKNGGVIYAEVQIIQNLTHVFQGKIDNSAFDSAFDEVKKFKFVEKISLSETKECSVTFIHGVTENEIRNFYEKLGFTGFLIKK